MKGRGPFNAKLWIIGDYPRQQDLDTETLFSPLSPAGRFLSSQIISVGMHDIPIRYEIIANNKPARTTIQNLAKESIEYAHIATRVQRLKNKIKLCKPNCIFLFGEGPLRFFAGEEKTIDKWRGHIIWDEELQVKLICSYHPTRCLRQQFFESHESPGKFHALFQADLSKAFKETEIKGTQFAKYEIIIPKTIEDVEEFFFDATQAKHLSVDIETCLPYGAHFMDCIGLAITLEKAMCIPLYIVEEGKKPLPYWDEPTMKRILKGLQFICQSTVPKVLQNAQFDVLVLWEYYNIKLNNIAWDTMIAAGNIYYDLPRDLGTLISLYANIPYQKYLVKSGKKEDRWEYCGADAIANLHVMEGEIAEAQELGVYNHYLNVSNDAILPMIGLQKEGVNVDLECRTKVMQWENSLICQIESAINKILPEEVKTDTTFNLASPQQKMKLFYDYLDCKVQYRRGSTRKLDRDDLRKLAEKEKRPGVKTLLEATIAFSEAAAMHSKLKTKLRNDRIHTAYGLGGITNPNQVAKETLSGTVTGRLNSKASDTMNIFDTTINKWVKSGTNLQNLKKGYQRKMIIPDEGEEFAVVDLYSAELFLVALDAQEKKIIDMANEGIKVHEWLQDTVLKKFEGEIDPKQFTYAISKRCVHALNYGLTLEAMPYQVGISSKIANFVFHFYHETFPGVRERMVLLRQEAENTNCVVSLLGRKRFFLAPMTDKIVKELYAWPSQSAIGEITIMATSRLYYWNEHHQRGYEDIPFMFPALNTHDGIVIRCKKGERERVKPWIKKAFNIPLKKGELEIVIPVEIAWGPNFNDLVEEGLL